MSNSFKPMPEFLSIFEQNQPLPSQITKEQTLSSLEYDRSKSDITKLIRTNNFKRFVEPPPYQKTTRMGTLRRITKKYSKKCKRDNLLHFLNWKDDLDLWNRKMGLSGDIYDTILSKHILPSGEKCESYLYRIFDKNFPETIHDNFTKSLFEFEYDAKSNTFTKQPKLKSEVLTEGNTVQMWKLLDKRGVVWHVTCVIWHNKEPYSFGFDGNFANNTNKLPNLALSSPNSYFEIALTRQKFKNPTLDTTLDKKNPKFVELLAMGVLDKHMITELTKILTNKTNTFNGVEYDAIFSGFEKINSETKELYTAHRDKLITAHEQWIEHIANKARLLDKTKNHTSKQLKAEPSEYSYNATVSLPILIDKFDKKPFQLSYVEIVMTFEDFKYCRKDPGRKSSKKNCMGGLDSIFQDLFSCRLFGTYIHPKLCGPKKTCFTLSNEEMPTNTLESKSVVSQVNNKEKLASVPNSVKQIVKSKKVSRAGNTTSAINGPRYYHRVLGRSKKIKKNKNTKIKKT